jgi:hypothetical protein
LFLPEVLMNHLALPPTDMFIGHLVQIGMSMGMGCLSRNNDTLVPLIPSLGARLADPYDHFRQRLGERNGQRSGCTPWNLADDIVDA